MRREGSGDEPRGAASGSVPLRRVSRRGLDLGIACKPEVVVGRKVDEWGVRCAVRGARRGARGAVEALAPYGVDVVPQGVEAVAFRSREVDDDRRALEVVDRLLDFVARAAVEEYPSA